MKTVQMIIPPAREDETWRVLDVRTTAARGPSRILLAPGALVMSRTIDAVGRTDAQACAAALSLLAPDMAMPAGDCVCALGSVQGGRRMVHAIARGALDALLARAKTQGYAPDAVIADFSVMPQPAPGAAIVAQRGDCLVRTSTAAFACDRELLPMILGEQTIEDVDFESVLIACVNQSRQVGIPDLLVAGGNAKVAAPRTMPIVAGIAAATALSIFAALPWIEAGRLNQTTSQLQSEAEALAREALPTAQRIVNPLAQLREASLPRAQAAIALANAVTVVEGLARSPGVSIARLSFDGEAVAAHVGVPNTSLLQPLRDHLATNGLLLVETPGLSEPNSIPVELTVTSP